MSESKLHVYFKRLRNFLCDWGIARPTGRYNDDYRGSTAPVWNNPARGYFCVLGSLNLIAFLIVITIVAVITEFEGDCLPGTIVLRNMLIFYFFFIGLILLYISAFKIRNDKQWSRYIIITLAINALAAANSIGLFVYLITEDTECEGDDADAYGASMTVFVLSLIFIGFYILLIAYTILKLYIRGNPLAFNMQQLQA